MALGLAQSGLEHAWRPLLSPMPAHGWEWLLLVPVVFFLCVAYKAVRCERLDRFWRSTLQMSGVVVVGLGVLAALGWVVVELLSMLPASG